jgi:hypothetical protein
MLQSIKVTDRYGNTVFAAERVGTDPVFQRTDRHYPASKPAIYSEADIHEMVEAAELIYTVTATVMPAPVQSSPLAKDYAMAA